MDDPRKNIHAIAITAEEKSTTGGLQDLIRERLGRVEWGNDGGQNRQQQKKHHDAQAHDKGGTAPCQPQRIGQPMAVGG